MPLYMHAVYKRITVGILFIPNWGEIDIHIGGSLSVFLFWDSKSVREGKIEILDTL